MKKVFYIFSAIFVVGISSLFLFTDTDKKISFYLQNFMESRGPSVPLVLVPGVDSDFEKYSLMVRELGGAGVVLGLENGASFECVDEMVEKTEPGIEKKAPLFNFKIVFPSKNISARDSKTPSLRKNLNSKTLPYSIHLAAKKDGKYYADGSFSFLLSFLGKPNVRVSDSAVFLKGASVPGGSSGNSIKIPRLSDGSVALKYPVKSWREYKNVPFRDFYRLSVLEEQLSVNLTKMAGLGLFGELNSDSPLDVFKAADDAGKNHTDEDYFFIRKKFYMIMSAYLSGNQERILCEATGDEEGIRIVKESFAECRKIFSEIETLRAKISDSIGGAICIFVVGSETDSEIISTPYDSDFPVQALPFVILNMILAQDFVAFLPWICAPLISLLLCLLFAGLFSVIKNDVLARIFSVFMILLVSCALVFVYVKLCLFVAFAVPVCSLILLSLILNAGRFWNFRKKIAAVSGNFSQDAPDILLKKIASNSGNFLLEGEKKEVSVLSLSIRNFNAVKKVLNAAQTVAFLNYYFERISSYIIEFNGLVESYRDDEMTALFGAPETNENHALLSVNAACGIKKADKSLNDDIMTYPKSPKPEGMNDDLYTAFFILGHNGIKILTDVGIWSGDAFCACMGGGARKAYRVADGAWCNAVMFRKLAEEIDASGVIIDVNTADFVKKDYILRNVRSVCQKASEPACEILDSLSSDDEKLWNYSMYWNQAFSLMEKGEDAKALAVFMKLAEGRPGDKVCRYFIKSINTVE